MLKLFSYWPKFIASLVFLVSLVLAIVLKAPAILAIPFAWILFPIAFDYCVNKTEQLFWLLIFLIPFSTELQITASLGLDFPDEPLMLLLTGLAILKFLHQPASFPKYLKTAPLFFLVVLMMAWSFLSASYAENPLLGYKFFLARIWYNIPFVILPQVLLDSQTRIRKMALYLLVPICLLAVQTLIRHSYYGFSFELVKKTIFPFFRNHVNYSAMLVCLLPMAWVMYQLTPNENTKKVWIKRDIRFTAKTNSVRNTNTVPIPKISKSSACSSSVACIKQTPRCAQVLLLAPDAPRLWIARKIAGLLVVITWLIRS